MHRTIATIRALIGLKVSINYVGKNLVSRTPGDVTDLNHN